MTKSADARIQIVFRKEWIVERDHQFVADYDTETEAVAVIACQLGEDVWSVRHRGSAARHSLRLTPAEAFEWDPA